jgi:hypothetical protein
MKLRILLLATVCLTSLQALAAMPCDKNLVLNAFATSGNTQEINPVNGQNIVICAVTFNSSVATLNTVKLTTGTGTNCGTGTADASIAVPLLASATNAPVQYTIALPEHITWTVPRGNAICVNLSAATAVNIQIWFTQYQ